MEALKKNNIKKQLFDSGHTSISGRKYWVLRVDWCLAQVASSEPRLTRYGRGLKPLQKTRLWGFTDGAEKQPEPDCIGEGPLRPAVWKEGQQDYKRPRSPRSQAVPPCRRPADGWAASGTAPPGSRRASYCCSKSPPSVFTSWAISTKTRAPLYTSHSPHCVIM